jgi:hypothetical protein
MSNIHRFSDLSGGNPPPRSAAEEDEARSREQYTGGAASGMAVLGPPTGSGVEGIVARVRAAGAAA